MQLKTLNRKLAEIDENLELVRGEGYCYFIFDDGDKNYHTKSVMVPRINYLSLESWIYEAQSFLKNVYKYM